MLSADPVAVQRELLHLSCIAGRITSSNSSTLEAVGCPGMVRLLMLVDGADMERSVAQAGGKLDEVTSHETSLLTEYGLSISHF